MDPDRKFVSDAAAGNREAFDELVRRYRRRVYNLVRQLTGGHCDAEDLVQEIFLRAYRAIGAFRGDSTFQSWLSMTPCRSSSQPINGSNSNNW